MKVSLLHPTGNPNVREAALAISEVNLLKEIVTAIATSPDLEASFYFKLLPKKLKNQLFYELGRRSWIPPENVNIKTYPYEEIIRLILAKTGLSSRLRLGATGPISWVYASLDKHFADNHLQDLTAVYCYEDGAAITFEKAKKKGILCLYDLPILFYQTSVKIQKEEAELFPELAPCLGSAKEPQWKLERKQKEIELADQIFVASSITKQSLLNAGVNSEKIAVIPYGSPLDYFSPQPKQDLLFRAIFVGRIGARKGVHYLLQAWQKMKLKDAELLLVGVNEFPTNYLEKYAECCKYISSVPHKELNQYYSSANVLVFPSLVEGFGLVLLEAMACGIPIIATYNTAAPDLITDGVEGFLIDIRDENALQKKLEWCYQNPEELKLMGKAARLKAEKLTWSLYRQKLGNKIISILN
jgi:glycosyltransferase involved in cell wall biosynthesis